MPSSLFSSVKPPSARGFSFRTSLLLLMSPLPMCHVGYGGGDRRRETGSCRQISYKYILFCHFSKVTLRTPSEAAVPHEACPRRLPTFPDRSTKLIYETIAKLQRRNPTKREPPSLSCPSAHGYQALTNKAKGREGAVCSRTLIRSGSTLHPNLDPPPLPPN